MTDGPAPVYVVDVGDYEQNSVCGVYSSPERAVAGLAAQHGPPYVVTWGDLEPFDDGRRKRWTVTARYENVPGYAVAHDALYMITEWVLDGPLNP